MLHFLSKVCRFYYNALIWVFLSLTYYQRVAPDKGCKTLQEEVDKLKTELNQAQLNLSIATSQLAAALKENEDLKHSSSDLQLQLPANNEYSSPNWNLQDGLEAINQEEVFEENQWKPGLCGIQNFGNTCYISAAMQCLFSLPAVQQYFMTYTAYRKHEDTWYHCDDTQVTPVSSFEEVVTPVAYILFYERLKLGAAV
ncbi:hypothetical protein EMCRGX_G015760 [Ephydatia muelleri]